MIIFGISIGTSRTGVCIVQDGKLIYAHVHDFRGPWSDNKQRIILNTYRKYFRQYAITDVMIKIPYGPECSKQVQRLRHRVEKMAAEYYCPFDFTTKSEIKGTFVLKSTEEIVKFATRMYPQLSALYEKGIATKHSFYIKLYEAVLAAAVYEQKYKARQKRKEITTE